MDAQTVEQFRDRLVVAQSLDYPERLIARDGAIAEFRTALFAEYLRRDSFRTDDREAVRSALAYWLSQTDEAIDGVLERIVPIALEGVFVYGSSSEDVPIAALAHTSDPFASFYVVLDIELGIDLSEPVDDVRRAFYERATALVRASNRGERQPLPWRFGLPSLVESLELSDDYRLEPFHTASVGYPPWRLEIALFDRMVLSDRWYTSQGANGK